MTKLFDWVKTHKLVTLLAIALLFLVANNLNSRQSVVSVRREMGMVAPSAGITNTAMMGDSSFGSKVGFAPPYNPSPVAPVEMTTRMVSKDTTLSLKVEDVEATATQIESIATTAGGYLIDSNLSLPEGAASATVSIRVPTEKRAEVLSQLRSASVKVVSEFVSGQDVTDQYVDNDERLRILESTKSKFETILADAKNVTEMLNVQRELLNVQAQIDSIKGQQKYLEGTTKLTRITVYLSTDELALPYAPDASWRPSVIFKEAVRSLVLNLRSIGTLFIWLLVYAPVIFVAAIVVLLIKRRMK